MKNSFRILPSLPHPDQPQILPPLLSQTDCLSPNGSITANVTGGTTPYEYKIGSGEFGTSSVFSNLKAGSYTITVEDDAGCSITMNASVASDTGITYNGDILKIFEAKCQFAGCHPSNGNWFDYNTAKGKAATIKSFTGNGTMPKSPQPGGPLSANEKALIACWVDDGAPEN